MSLAEGVARFKAKAIERANAIVEGTIREFSEMLVTEWTPFGDPLLWKSPPPADYVPGNLQSSWFYSVDAASAETTERTDIRAVNGLERMPERSFGRRHFLANNAPHASAIENAHSTQAPIGIMWAAQEFAPIVKQVALRVRS